MNTGSSLAEIARLMEPPEPLHIRSVDPRTERDRLLPVLRRNLSAAGTLDRYTWLYLDNPHGCARVWVAETARGEIVGTSAAHPKRAWIDGDLHDVLDLSDFAIDPSHRCAGPGLKLLRATLAHVAASEFSLSYDHPSRSMLALHHRLGGRDVSARRRWVRLLEVKHQLGRRFGTFGKLAGTAGDLWLRARDAFEGRKRYDISLLRRDCGDEFDRLDEETRTHARFRIQRSAVGLRWRFQRYPMARHEILCARERGVLCGYLVFRHCPNDVLAIVDLLTSNHARWIDPLIDALVAIGHERRQTAIWATVLRGSLVEHVIARHHFLPRGENAGMVISAPRLAPKLQAELRRPDRWWMLEGDEDV